MNAQRSLLCRVGVILFTLISCGQPASAERTDRTVIVVLIDGFAPSMVEAAETPHLDRIGREGSSSHHLAPVFPTMSMVNHTSFATGCWPEHHGIMSNIFVDPERGRFESSSDADWRTGCLSMWEIAESQNISAAALAITGSHSSASGALATHTLPDVAWEQRPSDKERTQSAIDLLNMVGPARPGLIVLYLTGPDDTAHNNGIAAPETLAAAREADTRVGELINVIDALPEDREVSLLIAADHGMANVSPLINVTKIMNKHRIRGQQASDGAAAFLYLDDPADIDAAYERLSTYSEFETFRRGEHPAWSHRKSVV